MPEAFTAKITQVVSADHFLVKISAKLLPRRLSLSNVEAPTPTQPGFAESRAYVQGLLQEIGFDVRIDVAKQTPLLLSGKVQLKNYWDLGTEMVRNGWACCPQGSTDAGMQALEAAARRDKRGMWASRNASPPWTADDYLRHRFWGESQ